MTSLIKKIHLYTGLISFSALMVYGIAGLTATFAPRKQPPPTSVRFEPYSPPRGASDKEVADDVYRKLAVPLADPEPAWAIKRDRNNDVSFSLYTINGQTHVTVLEKEGRLRVEGTRATLGHFFENLHTMTGWREGSDWRKKMWGAYNEIALWSLSLMVLTGAYLGLASRPRYRWGKYALAAGTTVFIALYVVIR